jgi:hypothetical protein
MSLISRLRLAASQAAETTIEYGADDPAELVALAEQIAAHENCTAECTVLPNQPHLLRVRFKRRISNQC